MIGSVYSSIPTQTIRSIPTVITTSEFFGYHNSYLSFDTLQPGYGYWVKVKESGKLILSVEGAATLGSKIKIVPTSERPPDPPVKLGNLNELPKSYKLEQNYPNPFNSSTIIHYQLPSDSKVILKIYNMLGQEVKTLVEEMQDAGYKSVQWDVSTLASGVYFYRLTANSEGKSFVAVKKLLLMK